MGLFSWISVGIIAGCLARDYMEGTGLDLWADVLIGIMGALTGSLAAVAVYGNRNVLMAASVNSTLMAFVGALLSLVFVKAFSKPIESR